MTNEELLEKMRGYIRSLDDTRDQEIYRTEAEDAEGVLEGLLEFMGLPPLVEPNPLDRACSNLRNAYFAMEEAEHAGDAAGVERENQRWRAAWVEVDTVKLEMVQAAQTKDTNAK